MMTLSDLERLREVSIENIDLSVLKKVEEVEIDYTLPIMQRMQNYLEEIGNPYCFLCGETVVRVRFSEDNGDLGRILKQYFLSLKR